MGRESDEFAEFYAVAKDNCMRAVQASIGDRQAAEELVAEAFARAWTSWRKVRAHPAPQAWVVRTALNTHVSWWRRRRREVALADYDRPVAESADGVVDGHLVSVLSRLSQRQREVLALRIFLDLDTARTAATLGIAPGTVTAHLARAIATLREEILPAQRKDSRR